MHFATLKAEERLLRHPAGNRPTPWLYGASRPELCRTFHEALLPRGQGCGRSHRIISAALEEQQAATYRASTAFSLRSRDANASFADGDFVSENHRINIARPEVFKEDPVNIIRLFHLADKHGLEFHPEAMQKLTRSLKLINSDLRENPEANKLFLKS